MPHLAGYLSFLLAAATAVDARTTVAVLEIGKGGVVRRTTSHSPQSSTAGVASFWKTLHEIDTGSQNRRHTKAMQHPGMTIVPDLFNKANGGFAIGLMGSGVDLDAMPTVSSLIENGSNADIMGFVGRFELADSQGQALMNKASKSLETVSESSNYGTSLDTKARNLLDNSGKNTLESLALKIDTESAAAEADTRLAKTLELIRRKADESEKTFVLHLVVEEEDGAARRRLLARRLEDEDENEDGEDENENENDDNANQAQYGWGYYNDYGEYITNYKSMFQIQYFNIVLWTSIGLTATLVLSTLYMIDMPLEPDTLLFGESAKMMGG